MDVYDGKGKSRKLGEKVGGGGQGNVYLVGSEPTKVVKIFHPDKLKERGAEFREKIELQKSMTELAEHSNIAWPRILVFDQNAHYIGYAMKRVEGVPLTKLAHPMLYERYFPNLDRIKIVKMLLILLDIVDDLHKRQVYIGDINLGNILSVLIPRPAIFVADGAGSARLSHFGSSAVVRYLNRFTASIEDINQEILDKDRQEDIEIEKKYANRFITGV